jgi:hypothetical protein
MKIRLPRSPCCCSQAHFLRHQPSLKPNPPANPAFKFPFRGSPASARSGGRSQAIIASTVSASVTENTTFGMAWPTRHLTARSDLTPDSRIRVHDRAFRDDARYFRTHRWSDRTSGLARCNGGAVYRRQVSDQPVHWQQQHGVDLRRCGRAHYRLRVGLLLGSDPSARRRVRESLR